MRIKVQLDVDGQVTKQDMLEIPEHKLGEMTEEEIEQAIEIKVRTWIDRIVRVEWEVLD
ncbi:hypothetical protein ABE504_07450 [Paenibacillus oryzisoli]|uniref:hypothetical protein n=1 Tax=Paenibacillus TaxID=44249 RepID=UPI0013DFBF9E|nr:hypothetical protein [Paenibacillus whitsoniae]